MPVTIKQRIISGLIGLFSFALSALFNFVAWQSASLELYRLDDGKVAGKISRVNCFVYKTEESLENVTGVAIRSSVSNSSGRKALMTKVVLTSSKGDTKIFLFGESDIDNAKKEMIVNQVSSFLVEKNKRDFIRRFDMYNYIFGVFTLIISLPYSFICFLSVFGISRINFGKISIT